MPLLISVDLGTGTVYASLVDATAGTIFAAGSRPALLYQPHPGIAEQDPDQYLAAAHQCMRDVFVIGLGLTHRWVLDLTGAMQGSEADPQADEFAALDARAALLPPGSEGALLVPHLGGRACPPDTTMRGGWLGLNWGHGRHHLYRAILEAGAYEHALGLQAMQRLYTDLRPDQILVIGGGASGAFWNQIKADVLGLPYQRLQPDKTAALGTVLLAGYEAGLFTDWPEPARRWSRAVERTMPELVRHQRYQSLIRC